MIVLDACVLSGFLESDDALANAARTTGVTVKDAPESRQA